MSYCAIKSLLNGFVVDIGSNSNLIMSDQTGAYTDSQLWEFAPSSTAGCFYIVSKLNGDVISVTGSTTFPGAKLLAAPKLNTAIVGGQSQLWQLLLDPAGSGHYVIQDLMFGYVIDIEGNSAQPGAGLDSNVLKLTGNTNQLWEAVGSAFPPAVQTAPPPPKVGGAWQWVLCGGTNPQAAVPIEGFGVEIFFSEALEVGPPLGFQVNGFSPAPVSGISTYETYSMNAWQQYVPLLNSGPNGVYSHIQNNPVPNWPGNVFENTDPSAPIAQLPTGNLVVPQGWTISMSLQYQAGAVVNGMYITVTDENGSPVGSPQTYDLTGMQPQPLGRNGQNLGTISVGDLAPLLALQLCIVRAWGSTSTTITSGAGTVTYLSTNPMTVTNYWPPNCAGAFGTAESANSTYGPIVPLGTLEGGIARKLPGEPIYRYVQSFGHS
jgi:hypothetical protein